RSGDAPFAGFARIVSHTHGLLDETAGLDQRPVVIVEATRDRYEFFVKIRTAEQLLQHLGQPRSRRLARMNNGCHPESLETGCVVGLVISEGYDHLRDAGAHCLSRRADAAV